MHLLRYVALLAAAVPIPLAAQDATPVAQTSGGYEVDFDNQNIQVVLSALAQAAGVNVTFSRLPDLRTTLRLGQPVPKDQLVDIMRQVAEGNGLVMKQTGSLIHISQRDGSNQRQSAGEPPPVQIYTYRLKHNSAVTLAPVLMNVFSGSSMGTIGGARRGGRTGGRTGGGGSGSTAGPGAVSLGNSSGGGAGGSGGGTGGGSPTVVWSTPNGGSGGAGGAVMRSFALDAASIDLGEMLGQAFSPQGNGGGNNGGGSGSGGGTGNAQRPSQVRIVAEEYTNTLLVRATQEEWELIKKIIEELD